MMCNILNISVLVPFKIPLEFFHLTKRLFSNRNNKILKLLFCYSDCYLESSEKQQSGQKARSLISIVKWMIEDDPIEQRGC